MRNSLPWATIMLAGLATVASADTTWSWRNPLPTSAGLTAAALINASTATVVGNGGTILRTTDGGATWKAQSSGTTQTLLGVSFTDANTGIAVGGGGTILRTTDGGATWTSQWPVRGDNFSGVSFIDAYTGIVVGISFVDPN